jgi:hypothetical protein
MMMLNSFTSNAAMKTLPYSEFLKLANTDVPNDRHAMAA